MSTTLLEETHKDRKLVLTRYGRGLGECGLQIDVKGETFLGKEANVYYEVNNIPRLLEALAFGYPDEMAEAVNNLRRKNKKRPIEWIGAFLEKLK